MTPEAKVKAAIKKWLAAHGFWAAAGKQPAVVRGWYYMPVNNGMGVSGIPDFIGSLVYDAHLGAVVPFAIEAKAPGEGPTERQKDRHVEMRAAGWLVLVADDVSKLAELEAYLG